ncbi:MAG: AI-2E family transporter [Salinivirgaceae bacterium]|nr:AI-2E family transporter [Salinivirgaceae bacterium]MBR5168602.1 AI-2E family transporter [Salinivirgaceae bacterium]
MDFASRNFTNKILLIFAVVLGLYILKILSFIFLPLTFACLFAVIFMPFMRWANKRRLPKYISLILAMVIIALVLGGAFVMITLTGQEFLTGRAELYQKLDVRIGQVIEPYVNMLDIEVQKDDGFIKGLLYKSDISKQVMSLLGPGLIHIKNISTSVLITLFLLVLILAGSVNFKLIMQETLFQTPQQVVQVFNKITFGISRFVVVKFCTSLMTGIVVGLLCLAFGISFPLLWGILTFFLNFIQMIGSIVVTIGVCAMAIIDITHPGVLTAAILLFIGIQILIGSVLEPIMLGDACDINTVTVLIMLLFWGFLWGIAGMMLAVPMAVLTKIICEQFEQTKGLARIMSSRK